MSRAHQARLCVLVFAVLSLFLTTPQQSRAAGEIPLRGAYARPSTVAVVYAYELDPSSVPATNDFVVKVNGARAAIGSVSVKYSTAWLALGTPLAPADAVTVSYTPGTLPLKSPHNDWTAVALTDEPVTYDAVAPRFTHGEAYGYTYDSGVTLYYDEQLSHYPDVQSTDFSVKIDGVAQSVSSVLLLYENTQVRLSVNAKLRGGQTVTVSYTPGTHPVQDWAGNKVAALSDKAVKNLMVIDTTPPKISKAEIEHGYLTVYFSESIDSGSIPARTDFSIKVNGILRDHEAALNVDNGGHNSISIFLGTEPGASSTDLVTVSYTPGTNPVQDVAGNTTPTVIDFPVTNITPPPDVTAPVLQEASVEMGTGYMQVGRPVLRLTYTEEMEDWINGNLSVADFGVKVNGEPQPTASRVYVWGPWLDLTLRKTIRSTDSVTVSYGPGEYYLRDEAGNRAAALSDEAVVNRMPSADTVAPYLLDAYSVDDRVYIEYDEGLDAGSVPSTSDYSLVLGAAGNRYSKPPLAVAVDAERGRIVLTAWKEITSTDNPAVAYRPGTNPVQDLASNDVPGNIGVLAPVRTAPDTRVTESMGVLVQGDAASFGFAANLDTSSYQCSLDGASFGACGSPKAYSQLSTGSHSFRVRAVKSGSVDPTPASRKWIEDGVAPSVPSIVPRVVSTASLKGTAGPVWVRWSASDGQGGITSYRLQRRSMLNGVWRAWGWSSLGTTAVTFTEWLPAGKYQYRVQARDVAGNWSGWRSSVAISPDTYQEGSAASVGKVSYTGTWNAGLSSYYSEGAVRYTATKGATASFTFTGGRQVAWVTTRRPSGGYAEVYLDGVKVATVNLYFASTQYRYVAFQRSFAFDPARRHTLKVYVTGTKDAYSTGRRVDVDGFVVLR